MVTVEKKDHAQDAGTKYSIEWVTENGYSIVRSCDDVGNLLGDRGGYCFVVRSPDGSEHEIVVEFDVAVIALIERLRRSPLSLANSFWITCAERALAIYLWKEDECPPNGKLILKELSLEELETARRCDSD